MKFGDYLRQKREERGWTQPEAALRVAIEQSYLSKLETGKSYPSEDVFARLREAYAFESADVVQRVASSEMAKLKEIGDVRAAVLDRQRSERVFARGWLIAMVACLTLGGACLGVASLSERFERRIFTYQSMGVLRPGEELESFDLIDRYRQLDPQDPGYAAKLSRQADLIERLDIVRQRTTDWRGWRYVEEMPDGLRYFYWEEGPPPPDVLHSPLRWFMAPGIALLAGSLGCAFASTRWK